MVWFTAYFNLYKRQCSSGLLIIQFPGWHRNTLLKGNLRKSLLLSAPRSQEAMSPVQQGWPDFPSNQSCFEIWDRYWRRPWSILDIEIVWLWIWSNFKNNLRVTTSWHVPCFPLIAAHLQGLPRGYPLLSPFLTWLWQKYYFKTVKKSACWNKCHITSLLWWVGEGHKKVIYLLSIIHGT